MNLKNRIAKTSFVVALLLVCSFVGHAVVYSYGSSATRTDRWSKAKVTTKSSSQQLALAQVTHLFYQPLYYGLVDEEVALVQDFLRKQGYFMYPISTGYYGPLTQAAVAAFQSANGINQTGVIDDQTRALINHQLQKQLTAIAADPVREQRYANVLGSVVIALQHAQQAHDDGVSNKITTTESTTAVRNFLNLVTGLFGLLR